MVKFFQITKKCWTLLFTRVIELWHINYSPSCRGALAQGSILIHYDSPVLSSSTSPEVHVVVIPATRVQACSPLNESSNIQSSVLPLPSRNSCFPTWGAHAAFVVRNRNFKQGRVLWYYTWRQFICLCGFFFIKRMVEQNSLLWVRRKWVQHKTSPCYKQWHQRRIQNILQFCCLNLYCCNSLWVLWGRVIE